MSSTSATLSRRRQLSEAFGLAVVAAVLTIAFGRELYRSLG